MASTSVTSKATTSVAVIPSKKVIPLASTDSQSWISKTVKQGKEKWDRKAITFSVARSLASAKKHEENGLPFGAEEYRLLYTKADSEVKTFAVRHGLDYRQIKAEMPALGQLERRSSRVPTVEARTSIKVLFGLVLFLLAPLFIGLWCGTFTSAFHFVVHHLG